MLMQSDLLLRLGWKVLCDWAGSSAHLMEASKTTHLQAPECQQLRNPSSLLDSPMASWQGGGDVSEYAASNLRVPLLVGRIGQTQTRVPLSQRVCLCAF